MKIRIEQYNHMFAIVAIYDDGKTKTWYYPYGESLVEMMFMFEEFGFDAEFEDVY